MRKIRPSPALAGAFALASFALLTGCAGEPHDATTKQLAALTAEISKLRASQAAMAERLEAVERSAGQPLLAPAAPPASDEPTALASLAPGASPSSLDGDRPDLDTVMLGPAAAPMDDDTADGDTDDDGPRVVLRSGKNGIIVEETGPDGVARPAAAKKPTSRKADKPDRKKTASLPTP
ncbi:MAG: hypothetical protein R3F14_44855 [Polyangiaceae bacterium]